MSYASPSEKQALARYRAAMDAVTEKDSNWRELLDRGPLGIPQLPQALAELESAWNAWRDAYCMWVREHAMSRIVSANAAYKVVNNPVDS